MSTTLRELHHVDMKSTSMALCYWFLSLKGTCERTQVVVTKEWLTENCQSTPKALILAQPIFMVMSCYIK